MKKLSLLCVASLVTAGAAFAQTFPGAGTGAIPDGDNGCAANSVDVPLDITFTVTDVFAPLSAVEVDMNVTHTWVGDLDVTLIAPDATEHVIYAGTGGATATACGDSSDLGGVYNFTDDGTPANWWDTATAAGGADVMAAGDYNSSAPGNGNEVNPGEVTSMNTAFAGVADPNGTWTLRIIDSGGGDTGAVTEANLFLMGGPNPDIIFENGFEELPPPTN